MAKDVYNLQVPIDLNLAETLRQLAEEDDRNLRSYCRRILQDHVRSLGKELLTTTTKNQIKEVEVTNDVIHECEEIIKKKRVGKLNKK